MAGLKEIRNRIASVITTRQVTSAMKMVSAAKLRKSQDALIKFRPYAFKFNEILANLAQNCEEAGENEFVKKRDLSRVLILVLSSNRGLCGAFNSNVIKLASVVIEEKYPNLWRQGKVDFVCIGKHGHDSLVKRKITPVGFYKTEIEKVNYRGAENIMSWLMEKYSSGYYSRVEFVYNQFKNAGVQILTHEQILPLEFPPRKTIQMQQDYIIEPDPLTVIEHLIPKYLNAQMYRILLESQAAEHGSRMTAMHKATDNASDLIRDLKLKYNKARQATITNEIIEIVGGSEALNN